MQRLVALLAVSIAAFGGLSLRAAAADYMQGMRGGLPAEWGFDGADPVGFEAGLRYWYSMGTQAISYSGGDFSSEDTSHILEKYFLIEDFSTDSYAKVYAGFASLISGSYSTPVDTGPITDGHIYYFVGDFGWMPFTLGGEGGAGVGAGGLFGYMYWNDSPSTGYTNFVDPDSVSWTTAGPDPIFGVDSDTQNLQIHALRLGASASGNLGPVSINAEVAAIPYAWVNGSLGSDAGFYDDPCSPPAADCGLYSASATTLDGHAFGATAEVMAGMSVFNDWNLRVGGRAWYLMGVANATITTVEITDASESDPIGAPGVYDVPGTATIQDIFDVTDVFTLLRLGALVELSKSF
ncbi:MAG: hypothetical protein WEB63_08480 [Cucumibacter sp.]